MVFYLFRIRVAKDFPPFIFKQCGKIVKSVLFGKLTSTELLVCFVAFWLVDLVLSVGFCDDKRLTNYRKSASIYTNAVWVVFVLLIGSGLFG